MKNGFTITLIFLIPLLAILVQAKFPVQIASDKIKFSPRLRSRSVVVYKDAMYVYGGHFGSRRALTATNIMYKYTFDTERNAVSMTLVDQVNAGPNCSLCGAVMINENQMMILTHEYANVDPEDPLSNTVVRPFIFDFTSSKWNTSISTPAFSGDETSFRMRITHNTVIHDEVIYTLGGANYFGNSNKALNTSWYYNITAHSYGLVRENGFKYRSTGGCSFNLPDNKIGSLLGKRGPFEYNNDTHMMVLDTKLKAWVEQRPLTSHGDVTETVGTSVQISRREDGTPNFAYFFGGYYRNEVNEVFYTDTSIKILNLQNNTWLDVKTLHHEPGNDYAVQRSYPNLALIGNKYLIIAFGNKDYFSPALADLDIIQLPMYRTENTLEENQNGRVPAIYVPSISGSEYIALGKRSLLSQDFFIKFFIIVIVIFLSLLFVYKAMKSVCKGGKNFLVNSTIHSFLWYRRAGESFTTQISRLIARLIFFATFLGFIYFFVHNIIHSSVSSTTMYTDMENVTFPDIRFCFTGFPNYTYAPRMVCSNWKAPYIVYGCTNIEKLESDAFTPSFGEQGFDKVFCEMYKSNASLSTVSRTGSTLTFQKIGVISDDKQMLYIQFYEPNKNPNRVVYFDEKLNGLDAYGMDRWIDSESVSGSTNNTINQVVYLRLDSSVHIQFKVVTTRQIDPSSIWNYIGIFPKYNINTELTVAHTESIRSALDDGSSESYTIPMLPGSIDVSPADYFYTTVTEKRDTTVVSVLGILGGILSILFFVEAILFGTKPSAPWGAVQNATFISRNRNGIKRNLSKYFSIPESGGLPFKTPVHPRFSRIFQLHEKHKKNDELNVESRNPEESAILCDSFAFKKLTEGDSASVTTLEGEISLLQRVNRLEARNQILELVLKTYYIDDKIFCELQESVKQTET